MASVWPAATLKLTSSTAVSSPRSVRKRVVEVPHLEQAAASRLRLVADQRQKPIFFFSSWSTQMRAWIGPGRSAPARSSPP